MMIPVLKGEVIRTVVGYVGIVERVAKNGRWADIAFVTIYGEDSFEWWSQRCPIADLHLLPYLSIPLPQRRAFHERFHLDTAGRFTKRHAGLPAA